MAFTGIYKLCLHADLLSSLKLLLLLYTHKHCTAQTSVRQDDSERQT